MIYDDDEQVGVTIIIHQCWASTREKRSSFPPSRASFIFLILAHDTFIRQRPVLPNTIEDRKKGSGILHRDTSRGEKTRTRTDAIEPR